MYIANPETAITPKAIGARATATVTMRFQAGSALYLNPAEFILIFDQSDGISQEAMNQMKAATKEFIHHISVASAGAASGTIINGSHMGLVGLSSSSNQEIGLTGEVSKLIAAIEHCR